MDFCGLHLEKVQRELATRIKEVLRTGKPFRLELHGKDGKVMSGEVAERFKTGAVDKRPGKVRQSNS